MINRILSCSAVSLLVFPLFLASGPTAIADLKIRGFADIVASKTDKNYSFSWLGNSGDRLNLDGSTRVGLNLSAELSDQWDFAGQILARGSSTQPGEQSSYITTADWLFFNYRPVEGLLFRFGRQIFPLFLYSEQIDVGFTYLWARLPTTVYGLVPVKSFNGASANYHRFFGPYEAKFGIFGGGGLYNQFSPGIGGSNISSFDVKGAYASLRSEYLTFNASYTFSRPAVTIYSASGTGTQVSQEIALGDVQNFSFGTQADVRNFIFRAEMGRFLSATRGTANNTGAYATAGYSLLNKRLTPHLTYGRTWNSDIFTVFPDKATVVANGTGASRTTWDQYIAGLNWRAADSVVVKVEAENDRYAYINTGLNFNAMTYTLSVDAVF